MLSINKGLLASGNLQSGGGSRDESKQHIKKQHITGYLAPCRPAGIWGMKAAVISARKETGLPEDGM